MVVTHCVGEEPLHFSSHAGRGTGLERHSGVKAFCIAFVLVLGCSRERPAATNTIAPADARPAATATSSIANRPALATAGSPRPAPRS